MTARRPLSRRALLGQSGLLALAASLPGCVTGTDPIADLDEPATGPVFVLVHGAWHGGWCWEPVKAALNHAGYRVHAPTLTGLGDRARELTADTGLEDHIRDVTDLITSRDLRDIILVGHSYGGMVITGAADRLRDRLRHVVYLDAALPKDGQTMISQGPPRPPEVLAQIEASLRALAPDGIAMQVFPPELLGIPKDHPRHGWVAERLTPHPLKSWLDPIRLTQGGAEGLPRTYIHCTDPVLPNSSFPWHAEQVRQDPAWTYHALATGHDAMVTMPEELAELLLATVS